MWSGVRWISCATSVYIFLLIRWSNWKNLWIIVRTYKYIMINNQKYFVLLFIRKIPLLFLYFTALFHFILFYFITFHLILFHFLFSSSVHEILSDIIIRYLLTNFEKMFMNCKFCRPGSMAGHCKISILVKDKEAYQGQRGVSAT